MATVSFRMDDTLKQRTEAILDELGLNMTTAMTMFAKTIVREQRLPLNLSVDPFYSASNQARLTRTIEDYEAGRAAPVTKSMEELERMAEDMAVFAVVEVEDPSEAIALEEYKAGYESSGKLMFLRIPRSLHRDLKEAAEAEGVSLNQYMLYKLAK